MDVQNTPTEQRNPALTIREGIFQVKTIFGIPSAFFWPMCFATVYAAVMLPWIIAFLTFSFAVYLSIFVLRDDPKEGLRLFFMSLQKSKPFIQSRNPIKYMDDTND